MDLGMLVQERDLLREPFWISDVVAVHASEILTPAQLHRLVQTAGKSEVLLPVNDSNARVIELSRNCQCSIPRAVINDD